MEPSKHLFWDTNPNEVDYEKNARWLIQRVLTRGKMSDIRQIQSYYGDVRILSEMMRTRHIDNTTLTFLSTVYHTPKDKFGCYDSTLLIQQQWPF